MPPRERRPLIPHAISLLLIPLVATITLFYLNPSLRSLAIQSIRPAKASLCSPSSSSSNFLHTAYITLTNTITATTTTFTTTTLLGLPTTMPRAPALALSHGGGPMPLLGDPSHKTLIDNLRSRVPKILKLGTPDAPRAIVLVTAHWQAAVPTVSSAAHHDLLYDYYGFPPAAYNLSYDAPGSPEVAAEVRQAFAAAGIEHAADARRGWDHGVFVPMLLVDPEGRVPIVQVSVLHSEDPGLHFVMGRALGRLRDRNIAVVGSGFASVHNIRAMLDGSISSPGFLETNRRFSAQVDDALAPEDVAEREAKLAGWRGFEGSYAMHPRGGAEHFLPLLVCAAAGLQGKMQKYADDYKGLPTWNYYWE